MLGGMFGDPINVFATTLSDARDHIAELEEERELAVRTGVAEIDSYRHDLELELEVWRNLYVTTAVSEIAMLRAELSGPQLG
jgi:hypothetical protein